MHNSLKTNEINDFKEFITTPFGKLAGIITLIQIANIVFNVIPLPVDFYGKSTAPVAIPVTTLSCIFVIYLSFVQRNIRYFNPTLRILKVTFQWAFYFLILGFVSLGIFFLLKDFEYPLRDWFSKLTTINLDSTKDYVLMLVGIVPFYILFFACVTRAFSILAIVEIDLKEIQETAEKTYQESKGTPAEEIAYAVHQEVQKWRISDQEQMKQNIDHLTFSFKTKIPENQANRHIYEKIEDIKKEKDLVKQYQLVAILIESIPQIIIGGNMTGDIYSNVHIVGNRNVVGKDNVITINQQQLAKIPNEYAKSLQAFSEAVNTQLKKYNISQEKAAPVQESINELVKEVEGIKPEEKIDIEKKENIKSKITKVAIRLLKIIPKGAETAAIFTPLAPFSKIIGKSVEEIMKVIQNEIQ